MEQELRSEPVLGLQMVQALDLGQERDLEPHSEQEPEQEQERALTAQHPQASASRLFSGLLLQEL